jgi:hypothetical protein
LLITRVGITGAPEYQEVKEMSPRVEKMRFAASLAEMVVVYIIPQMAGFYLFARLYL